MYIKVTNISNFLSFILDALGNGEKSIRVFISDKQTSWDFPDKKFNEKIKFTYVLFTHLYQVVYSDSVKDDEYTKILNSLKDYQEQFNESFAITRFEKIKFDKDLNQLLIENELYTF